MVTQYILDGIFGVVTWIVGLLPTTSANFTGWVSDMVDKAQPVNYFLDLATLVVVVGIITSWEVGFLMFKVTMYIYKKVRSG